VGLVTAAPEKNDPGSFFSKNESIPPRNGKSVARLWVRIPGLAA
jgi:hypothetical protein